MAEPTPSRVQAFDWLRGLAVLFMVQCHALKLLAPEHQTDALYRFLIRLDGLVAPSFIFSAGFSLALVQVRTARGQGSRRARLRKTLRRLGEVLAVATLVNAIWFPILSEPHWLWRLDILHCIGLSLLLALPLLFGLAGRPQVLKWVTLGLAALVFGVSPLFEKDAGAFNWLLNRTTDAQFPLLPWAGYVYLGASAGATAASTDLKGLVRWLLGLIAVGALLWWQSKAFQAAYPEHNFWVTNPAEAGQRWTKVLGVLLVLLFLENKVPAIAKSLPVRFLSVFGGSSMAAYFFHEMALFKPLPLIGFSFNKVWGGKVDWPAYWGLLALLIAWTYLCVWVTDKVYRRVDAKVSGKPKPPSLSPASL